MGPAVFTAGDVREPVVRVRSSLSLQWGPRFSPRETVSRNLTCFQVATVHVASGARRRAHGGSDRPASDAQKGGILLQLSGNRALRAVPGVARSPHRSRHQTITGARSDGRYFWPRAVIDVRPRPSDGPTSMKST